MPFGAKYSVSLAAVFAVAVIVISLCSSAAGHGGHGGRGHGRGGGGGQGHGRGGGQEREITNNRGGLGRLNARQVRDEYTKPVNKHYEVFWLLSAKQHNNIVYVHHANINIICSSIFMCRNYFMHLCIYNV